MKRVPGLVRGSGSLLGVAGNSSGSQRQGYMWLLLAINRHTRCTLQQLHRVRLLPLLVTLQRVPLPPGHTHDAIAPSCQRPVPRLRGAVHHPARPHKVRGPVHLNGQRLASSRTAAMSMLNAPSAVRCSMTGACCHVLAGSCCSALNTERCSCDALATVAPSSACSQLAVHSCSCCAVRHPARPC